MSTLIRSLWLVRAWTGLSLVGAAVLIASVLPSAWTALGLALALLAEGAALVAQARLVAALRDGGRGEVLMRAGARVPLAMLRAQHAADRAEVIAAVLVPLLGLPPAVALGGSVGAVVLAAAAFMTLVHVVLIDRQRRWSHALVETLVALLDHDLERAERLLGPLERAGPGVYRASAEGLRGQLELVRGERDAALRIFERTWTGAIDDGAATLALLRLGAGDPGLAERYLAATVAPANRYERYLVALVGAHLALHHRRWDDAIAAARTPVDVPDPYVRQLALAEVAALQGAGWSAEAQERLGGIRPGLEVERWRERAHPLQWGLLADAAAGRETTTFAGPVAPVARPAAGPVRDADHVFAPPDAAPAPRTRAATVGAIPVEGMLLAERRPVTLTVVALATTGLLVGLSLVTLVLLLVVHALGAGEDDPELLRVAAALGAFGLVLGLGMLAEPAVAWSAGRERPAVVLSDGRRVGDRWFRLWSLSMVLPQLGSAVLLLALLGFLENLGGQQRWMYLVGVPFGVLYAWWGWRRWSGARLVRAVHFLPPERAVAVAERTWRRVVPGEGYGLAWLALARLWSGDEAGAARDAREAALVHPDLAWLDGWIRAGRGEVDLDRVLAEPDPEALGDRYRRAVLVALAALRAGAAARVADRLDDWTRLAEDLPNRYGALLWRLVLAVRRANGQAVELPADPDLAWVGRVWPFVR